MKVTHFIVMNKKILRERPVVIKLAPANALQNLVRTFFLTLIMINAKPIYQIVIYQETKHVQLLEQEPVIHTRQRADPIMRKRPLAADNRTLMELLVDI